MTYTNQPDQGYSNTPSGGQPTYSEAWALIAAARQIVESTQVEGAKEGKRAMQEALRTNWKLWTIFQAELSDEAEANIPNDIRINMLTLAKFVDNHTVQQLQDPSPERLLVLVDINRNIANGLLEGASSNEQNTIQTPSAPSQHVNDPATPIDPELLKGLNQEA